MNINTSSIANLGHRAPSWQCRRGDASHTGEDTLHGVNCAPYARVRNIYSETFFGFMFHFYNTTH